MKKVRIVLGVLVLSFLLPSCEATRLGGVIKRGNIDDVNASIDQGADVNENGLAGATPLYEAAFYNSSFSGAGGRSVLAKGARPLVMNLNTAAPAKKMTVLAASSGAQISSAYNEKGHGLFTYFMLKGIRDEGVLKPDGSLDVPALFGYLKPQVKSIARKQYNNEQTPQLIQPIKD